MEPAQILGQTLQAARDFLELGGAALWVIAALSVITLALILWKVMRLATMGAWSGRRAKKAIGLWHDGQTDTAIDRVKGARGVLSRMTHTAMAARLDPALTDTAAREETERVARGLLDRARGGLRPLELIATIAPLVGLLGTVLGMIAAFQALQEAGGRADPATLAGGIWEALLTTAAGMAVAIPATMALTWFESVVDRLRLQMEDAATRIFLTKVPADAAQPLRDAA